MTKQAVGLWVNCSDPMPKQRNGYDLSKIVQWHRRQSSNSNINDELKTAEIRLKTIQAQHKELQYEEEKGRLLDRDEVELWASIALIETREMIMGLPEMLATSSPPEFRDFVRVESERHCRDVLTMLRRRLETENIEDKTATDDPA